MVEFYEVNENDIESYLTYTNNDYLFFYGHRVSCTKTKLLETKCVLENFVLIYGYDEYVTFIDDIRNSKIGYIKLNELSINSIRHFWRYYNSFIFFTLKTNSEWESFQRMIKELEINLQSEVQLKLIKNLKLEKIYAKIDDVLAIYSAEHNEFAYEV